MQFLNQMFKNLMRDRKDPVQKWEWNLPSLKDKNHIMKV